MPKQRRPIGRAEVGGQNPRSNGLRHLQAGRFDEAIAAWQPFASEPAVRVALAEAYFRRSLTQPDDRRADDLRLALTFLPDDPRLHYQFGLLLHRQNNFAAAQEQYAHVATANPRWQGLARARGLVAIEQGKYDEAVQGEGLTSGDRQFLNAVGMLLRHEIPPEGGSDRISHFWRGLGLLQAGDAAEARTELTGSKPNRIGNYYLYYAGLAAALTGDAQGALASWREAAERGYRTPWMLNNVAAVRYAELQRLLAEGKQAEAARFAQLGVQMATGNSALAALEVETLDGAARAAVANNDWANAASCWEAARTIAAQADGMGSPRPLLHNLALAYEALERWKDAAEAWRAMLRTRPRKGSAAAGELSAEQWSWVRRRVIECYKRADAPAEAVAVFRQAIKADPSDVELRLELSDALLANEQPQAAFNEILRVLERDEKNIDALLRAASYQVARNVWYEKKTYLEKVVALNPERADHRENLAFLLSRAGSQYNEFGQYEQAYGAFSDAVRFAPEAYMNHLNLARVAFNTKQTDVARQHLAEALRLGADQTDAYVEALDCWMLEGDQEEARAIIARAEEALPSKQEFYFEAGANLLDTSNDSLFFGSPFGQPKKRTFADTVWTQLGQELLDRAISLRPDDPEVRAHIASLLMQSRPDIGLRYAGEAVALAPNEPQYQVLQGLLQGLSGDTKTARETFQKAGRLARKQGNREIAEQADMLRSQVNSPLFGLAFQMGGLFDDDDDEEWI